MEESDILAGWFGVLRRKKTYRYAKGTAGGGAQWGGSLQGNRGFPWIRCWFNNSWLSVLLLRWRVTGCLKLFGNLPDAGRVDDFLFLAGGAKLRKPAPILAGKVNEAAGASFFGPFRVWGNGLCNCQCDELG